MPCALLLTLAACGGDDGGADDHGDEASFCRLAQRVAPVADADAESLVRLEELAPEEIRTQVGVLRDLAERVADIGAGDPESLALEFEVRFSDEFVDARRDVEAYQEAECTDDVRSTTTGSTSTTDTTDETGSDDG